MVLVLWMGGREVLQGRMTIGSFTAFNIYMMQLTFPIIALGWVINIFQRGTASLIRLNEILQDCTAQERYEMTVKNVVELYNLPFKLEGPAQAKVAAGVGRS